MQRKGQQAGSKQEAGDFLYAEETSAPISGKVSSEHISVALCLSCTKKKKNQTKKGVLDCQSMCVIVRTC